MCFLNRHVERRPKLKPNPRTSIFFRAAPVVSPLRGPRICLEKDLRAMCIYGDRSTYPALQSPPVGGDGMEHDEQKDPVARSMFIIDNRALPERNVN